ncbi:MAG: malate dehydrogenase [Sulfurimonas sp.]|nr:MAG: malate dehydrogenase [Sulfurimonas sp.]
MMGRKVGIVGSGFVGATAAYTLSLLGTCHEIVLYDIVPEVAKGKAIDIGHSTCCFGHNTTVSAAETPEQMQDCDIVVVTAGVPRRGEMTRADLLMINAKIMKQVIRDIKKYSPNAIVLVVSNPLDVMTYMALQETGWERHRVLGMAGALDGSRMAYQIHQKVGYGAGQTRAMVIGEHGQHMIPYPEISAVGGVPLDQIVDRETMDQIIEGTKDGGAEIVRYLGTSAYYAPGCAIAVMVGAMLDDSRIVTPSSVMLEGEYGYHGITVGVPVVLGSRGIEQIIELELNDELQKKFKASVASIQEGVDILQEQGFF